LEIVKVQLKHLDLLNVSRRLCKTPLPKLNLYQLRIAFSQQYLSEVDTNRRRAYGLAQGPN